MQPITQPGQRHLLNQIVRFSQSLHGAGVPVNPANLIDLCRCMSFIDISKRLDFHAAARATLVSSERDIAVFDQAFSEFWSQAGAPDEELQDPLEEALAMEPDTAKAAHEQRLNCVADEGAQEQQEALEDALPAYSPDEFLMKKDFALMSGQEIEQARRLVVALIAIMASYQSRRREPGRKGSELNLRKMLRQNAFFSQDELRLLFRKKKIKKIKLMLLCDVSGSMERYSSFLIQFIYAMRQQLASLDVAVFSTRMTVISDFLHRQSIEQSLREISANVRDWGGGTNIGNSLREFNKRFARDAIAAHTVVIILSDGWDRGDATVMREEMQQLHHRVRKLVWLNPLLGDASYQPLCRGIQTALPFIDHFLPAHNLDSFAQLIRMLRTAWR